MKRLLLPALALLIPFHCYTVPSQVELLLVQDVDKDCDGNPEQSTQAASGECIIYTITTVNKSETAIFDLEISGRIPSHTQLFDNMPLEHTIFNLETEIKTGAEFSEIIGRIRRLEPGEDHKLVLQYAVQVD